MTQQTNPDGSSAIAQAVNGFGELKARQISIHGWRVLSWRNDSVNAYVVNLRDLSCNCEDNKYNKTQNTEVCDHIAVALYQAKGHMDVGEALNFDLLEQTRTLQDAVQKMERRASGLEADVAAESSDSEEQQGSYDDDDNDAAVIEDVPDDDQEELLDDLSAWMDQAAGFNDFDPSIIDLSWAIADGHEGVAVERQPFDAGYYDDGEWQDKDAYDEHSETARETVLSPRDEFEWHGEPDYCHFIAAEDIPGVVE